MTTDHLNLKLLIFVDILQVLRFDLKNVQDFGNFKLSSMFTTTGPDSLVDKASASEAGGRRFDSQCRRH